MLESPVGDYEQPNLSLQAIFYVELDDVGLDGFLVLLRETDQAESLATVKNMFTLCTNKRLSTISNGIPLKGVGVL
jgi:hypothetical protein